jgi:hypothetical protein
MMWGVTAKRVGAGLLAALLVPFVITGLFRLGLPGPAPFAVVFAIAATCWFRRYRAVAMGLCVGAAFWALALILILNAMGDGLDAIG